MEGGASTQAHSTNNNNNNNVSNINAPIGVTIDAAASSSQQQRKNQSLFSDVAPPAEEISYDLSAITVSKATLEPIPIDGAGEMLRFLQSGTLKGIENVKLRERFIQSVTLPQVGKIVRLSFYFILVSNFPECVKFDEEEDISNNLKQRLSKNYVKLFSTLPQPKDEIVNLIIFCVGYVCHLMFYKLFSKQREMFDLRFVFNCYHILIFEFNGIFVSDFFVRMNIDKIFVQHKFLDYERVNKKNMMLLQLEKNKSKTKTFFGFPLAFPDTHGSQDAFSFNKQLSDKFKPPKKNLHILDDQVFDQASSQEKQVKIRNELRNKRRKQIEEAMLSKAGGQARLSLSTIPMTSRGAMQQQSLEGEAAIISTAAPQQESANPPTMAPQTLPPAVMKQALEKAEAIFARTEVRYDDPHSTKEDANYFANLQLNCNQISPTISTLLAYDNRTLPYAKKKMIRHAFETVNDKEDNLLQQLKQFSQSRKQKKETKFQQKSNKSIIDHFGLRPPPREYYQKHPKLDKMFKDMLDINYVLKMNTESMQQLPSSVAMQSEQANEWQKQIIDQENNYNKQNQRQKESDSLADIVMKNQLFHLEERPGYRKKYIYTKPPQQYIKQQQLQSQQLMQLQQISQSIQPTHARNAANGAINTHTTAVNVSPIDVAAALAKQATAMSKDSVDVNVTVDEVLQRTNTNMNSSMLGSPQKMLQSLNGGVNAFSLPSLPSAFAADKKQKGATAVSSQMSEHNPNPHRMIEFKSIEQDTKNNGRGQYFEEENETIEQRILKNKQNSDFYNDKRRQYKETYKGFINNMSTDNNIDDILQNILHKRNQFNRNLRSKIKNL